MSSQPLKMRLREKPHAMKLAANFTQRGWFQAPGLIYKILTLRVPNMSEDKMSVCRELLNGDKLVNGGKLLSDRHRGSERLRCVTLI